MKGIFTKKWMNWLTGVILLVIGATAMASAQDVKVAIPSGNDEGATAICKDASNNVFVLRDASAPIQESGSGAGQVNGAVDEYNSSGVQVGSGPVIANTGAYRGPDGDATLAVGITVDASDNIYVTTYNDFPTSTPSNIVKFFQSTNYATSITLLTGSDTQYGYFGSLACDSHGNIYTVAVNDADGSNTNVLIKIPNTPANSTPVAQSSVVLIDGTTFANTENNSFGNSTFTTDNGNYVPPTCLAIDANDNIFLATNWGYYEPGSTVIGFDGGNLYKYIPTAKGSGIYGSAGLLKSSFYGTGLDCDPVTGDVIATVITSPGTSINNFSVINYGPGAAGGPGFPATLYTSLHSGDLFPWGMAAVSSTNIFVDNGSDDSTNGFAGGSDDGDLYELIGTPTTQANNVNFTGTTEKTTTINWTNGDGASRAVFAALSSAGSISLTNGTAYTPSTTFGLGTAAGAGWNCVYNGTGSTNSVAISNLTANTGYKVMVVEFNGPTGAQNYDTGTGTNNPNTFTTLAAPSLTASGGTDSYSLGGTAATVDAGITVTAGQTNLNTATINVSTGRSTGDLLNFTNQNGILGSFNATTGVLTLTGSSSVANYQTALQSITFSSSSASTSTRTISFLVGDGTSNSNTVTKNITVSASTSLSSIALVNAATNNLSSVQYTVNFAAAVGGLGTTNFTATGVSGTLSGQSVTAVNGSNPYTVTVSTGSGSGTLRLDLTSNSGLSPAVSNEPYTSGPSYTIDRTAPAVSTVTAPVSGTYGQGGTIILTVNYSEAVTVNTGGGTPFIPITLNTGGTVQAAYTSGSGTANLQFRYLVVAGNNDPDGITVGSSITANGGTLTDGVGNSANLTLNNVGSTAGVLVDGISPTVNSIVATGSSPTNATSVSYTVTFSEAVSGVGAGDFTATTSGVSTTSITVTPISSSIYTVTVNGVNGNGTVRLDLNSGAGIFDLSSNQISGGFTGGDTYTIDQIAPSVSFITATTPSNTNPTNATSVTYTVTFSEGVTGVDNTDFTATVSGVSSTGITVTPVSSSVYTVVVSGISGNGTLRLDLNSSGTGIADLAGNAISGGFTGGDMYTIDQTAPTVLSLVTSDPNPINQNVLDYQVTFSEPVTGVDASDFSAVTSGVSSGTISLSPLSSTVYNITISNVNGTGTYQLNLNGSGTGITDAAGNAAAGFSGETYDVDQTPPAVSSIAATSPGNTNPTNATGVTYTVTFNEAVTGVDNTDFTATTSGVTTTGIIVTPVSGSVYTVTVNGISGNGTLRLDLNSSGTAIFDSAANPVSGGFTGGDTYTVDQTAPTATISAPSVTQTGNSGSSSVTYTVTYSDANFSTSTLTGSGITLNTSGTATGTIGVSGSGTSYTVTISGIMGLGTVGISLDAGFASDLTGNTDAGAPASATFNVISSDATLSSLAISDGTLSPNFATGQMSYTASVSNAVASVTVTPASSDPNAIIQVNGVTVASTATSGPIALTEGAATTINTVVTAPDGTTMATYSISVTRAPSGNARLSTIALSPHASLVNTGTVGTTTSYGATVGNGITSVTVTPTAQDPTAVITVNSATVASGAPSGSIALGTEGSTTTITTVVTSQNGAATRTYSINVTRAPSADPRLSTIILSPYAGLVNTGTVGSTTTYTASVSNATASLTVTPTAIDPNATIKVNGATVSSGTASGSLALGAEGSTTTITIIAKAQDGITTRTYSIAVTRQPSADPRLATIVTNPHAGLTNTGTVGNTTTYTTAVINAITTMTVTPTAIDPNAVITVNGTAVASGTASPSISLAAGQTTITIISTSQDGSATRTYTITVTRPSTNNAELITIALTPASLLVNTGTVGNTTSYTTSVDNATTSVTVTPTALDPNATIKVAGITVASGTVSGSISLAVGQTTITTVVTAVDGIETRTYSITVTRASGALLSLHQPEISVTKPSDNVSIENDGIIVHQGVSPNGDGINDFLTIDGINQYPDNQLTIIDRNGALLYQAKGYDNGSKAFDGHSNMNGKQLQSGTYFYSLDYSVNGQSKHKTGYILLKY